MSRPPSNPTNPFGNPGTFSNMGDGSNNHRLNHSQPPLGNSSSNSGIVPSSRNQFSNNNNNNNNNNYSYSQSLNDINTAKVPRESNYTLGNVFRGEHQHPVTWRLEQPNHQHAYIPPHGDGGPIIPVTWKIESNQHTHHSAATSSNQYPIQPPPHQHHLNSMYNNTNGQLSNHGFSSTVYTQHQQQQPSYSFHNNAPPSMQHYTNVSIAIPPPPPPPPPPKMRGPSPAFSVENVVQSAQKAVEVRKEKRPRDDSKLQQQQQQGNKKSLRWQPPTVTEKKLAWQPPLGSKAIDSTNKSNAKELSSNSIEPITSKSLPATQNKPNTSKSTPATAQSITESHDANVSAINALSALETRWTAPNSGGGGGSSNKPPSTTTTTTATTNSSSNNKLTGKAARRRRNRANKKAKAAAAATASSTNTMNSQSNTTKSISNAVELIGEWINVEDSPSSSNYIINQSEKNSLKSREQESTTTVREVIDLTGDDLDFPPLSSLSPKEVGKSNDKSNTVNKSNEAASTIANYSDLALEQMSQCQLTSYAAVLSRAIDENKAAQEVDKSKDNVDESSRAIDAKKAAQESYKSNDTIDKSNDAASTVAKYKNVTLEQISKSQLTSYATALSHAIDENKTALQNKDLFKSDSAGDEMDISDEETEEETKELTLHETSSNTSNTDFNPSLPLDSNVTQSTVEMSSRSDDEKEKYRLRLEELRAKAKLANAKLRLAKKKQAMKSDDVISLQPPPNNKPPPNKPASNKPASETDSINNVNSQEQSAMRMLRPLSDTIVSDLTAVRMIGSLVVNVNLITGPRDKVRYVHSVYDDSSSDDESDPGPKDPPIEDVKPLASDVDSSKKASESLKQKLHLAKLRLELKKKELALKKKQSEAPVKNLNSSEAAPAVDQSVSTENTEINATTNDQVSTINKDDEAKPPAAIDSNNNNSCAPTLEEQKAAQIEELKRRQKELKQSNEVSNLRNLVQRQREILRVKGKELTDSSAQLQSCISEIKTKQEQLTMSEKRQEEMTHRKRIMEGMILRAIDKLMTARRNLQEKQAH